MANFVYLIQQKDWVVSLDLYQGLDYYSRHAANVSSSVTSDQSFISDSSQCNFVELPAKSLSNTFSKTGFSNSRRSAEAKNGTLIILFELPDSQELHDSFLYLFETKVVLVKDGLTMVWIVFFSLACVPGKVAQRGEVVQAHMVLLVSWIKSLDLLKFLVNNLLCFLWQLACVKLLLKIDNLVVTRVLASSRRA